MYSRLRLDPPRAAASGTSVTPPSPATPPAFQPTALSVTIDPSLQLAGALNSQLSYFTDQNTSLDGNLCARFRAVPLCLTAAWRNATPAAARLDATLTDGSSAMAARQSSATLGEGSIGISMSGMAPQINIPSLMGDPNGNGWSFFIGMPREISRVGLSVFFSQLRSENPGVSHDVIAGVRGIDDVTSFWQHLTLQTPVLGNGMRFALTGNFFTNPYVFWGSNSGQTVSPGQTEADIVAPSPASGVSATLSMEFARDRSSDLVTPHPMNATEWFRNTLAMGVASSSVLRNSGEAARWVVVPPQSGNMSLFWLLGGMNVSLSGFQTGGVAGIMQDSLRRGNTWQKVSAGGAYALLTGVQLIAASNSAWESINPPRFANGADLIWPATLSAGVASAAASFIPADHWSFPLTAGVLGAGGLGLLIGGLASTPSSFFDLPSTTDTPRQRAEFIANGGSAREEAQLRSAYRLAGIGAAFTSLGLSMLGQRRDWRLPQTTSSSNTTQSNVQASSRPQLSGIQCGVSANGFNCGLNGTF